MLTDLFVMTREERLAEEQAEAQHKERLAGPKKPEPPRGARCFGCWATVEWKPRVPPDWRVGPLGQYEPGTDIKHVCKPLPKLIDYREEQWRKRQREAEEKVTLRVGGKSVDL